MIAKHVWQGLSCEIWPRAGWLGDARQRFCLLCGVGIPAARIQLTALAMDAAWRALIARAANLFEQLLRPRAPLPDPTQAPFYRLGGHHTVVLLAISSHPGSLVLSPPSYV